MGWKININWKKVGHAVKEFFISLGRGDLLTRLRVDRLLPYILYLFVLGCISIWMSYKAEQTMLRVQKNNETIRTLKIYNAQKTYEIVGLDRIATVEKMLEEATEEQKASLAEHKTVLESVKRRVNQMTAGVPLNKY